MNNFIFTDLAGSISVICFFVLMILLAFAMRPIICRKRTGIAGGVMFSVLASVCFVCAGFITNEPLFYIAVFCAGLLLPVLLLHMRKVSAAFAAVSFVFHLLCVKALVIGTYSMLIKKNMYRIVHDPGLMNRANVACMVVLCLMTVLYIQIFRWKRDKAAIFFKSPKQLNANISVQAFLTLFMLYFSYNYYFSLDLVWFSLSQILTALFALGTYWVVLAYGAGMSAALHRIRERQQHRRMDAQLANYAQRESSLQNQQRFKHDQEEAILSLNYLLKSGDVDGALKYVDKIQRTMDETLPKVTRYSNNNIINALLLSYENIAGEKDIDFRAQIFIPDSCPVADEELHDVFTGVLENAVRESAKVSSGRRYIDVESNYHNRWLTVKMENSCTGKFPMINGRVVIKTTENDYVEHGLDIVNGIFEKYNGITDYKYSSEEHKFITTLSVRC